MNFDEHGTDYSRQVDRALSVVGLPHDFFFESKVEHILAAARRAAAGEEPRVLEVGCGIGLLQQRLRPLLPGILGVDPSIASVALGATSSGRLVAADGLRLPFAGGSFHLVLAVSVLHHVPVDRRAALLAEMARVARPGGLVTLCEHNPWNPLTRLVVARCAFDRDAVLLTATEARRRLATAGLTGIRSRYVLFFPWRGAIWRRLETVLASLPLGGQYFVDARRE